MESIKPHCPDLYKEFKDMTREGGMRKLGTTGATTLYAKNYMSPIHRDYDKIKAITAQLQRQARNDEFHFAFVEWGFYIQTVAGAIW